MARRISRRGLFSWRSEPVRQKPIEVHRPDLQDPTQGGASKPKDGTKEMPKFGKNAKTAEERERAYHLNKLRSKNSTELQRIRAGRRLKEMKEAKRQEYLQILRDPKESRAKKDFAARRLWQMKHGMKKQPPPFRNY